MTHHHILDPVAALVVTAVALVGAQRPTTHFADIGFTAHYDGRGAEGIDDIWRGTLDAPDRGVITIRIEHLSPTTGVALRALVFVSPEDITRSFGAELTGNVTQTGTAHLSGTVDIGAALGAPVDLTMPVNDERHGHHGTIRFTPARARSSPGDRGVISMRNIVRQCLETIAPRRAMMTLSACIAHSRATA